MYGPSGDEVERDPVAPSFDIVYYKDDVLGLTAISDKDVQTQGRRYQSENKDNVAQECNKQKFSQAE